MITGKHWDLTTAAAATALVLVALSAASAAEIGPGSTVDKTNVQLVKDVIPPGVAWCVGNGMTMEIVPYKEIPAPRLYAEATEKYASQVTLADDNMVKNWVAGKPFPDVDPNDPQAAIKIMYNFERTHYYSESLDMHLADADTGSLYTDSKGNRHYTVERHFVPEWLRLMRYEGRLYNDPKPLLLPNNDETFYKAGLYPLIEPFDLKGVGGVSFRYQDQARHDDTWLYLPFTRRVRRMSTAQRSDALFGQDIDVDSFGGYAGQIPWFEWRLLGHKPMYMSLHGERLPPEPCKGDGGMTFCEKWEMRPDVYIVEGVSKSPNYAYSKRIIFIDKETNIIGVSDLYDQGGELWKTVMLSFRASTRPNPDVEFEYDETRMFAYAYSVIDMQLMHGTRVAIPGLAFQDEAGWYIDLGFDVATAADESWFSIPGLINAGR
ncbi:MAG: DUF1329 domain-containing protein [Candidatus Binatia bacterium]